MNLNEILRGKRSRIFLNLIQALSNSPYAVQIDNSDDLRVDRNNKRKLKIAYIMNHVRVCGGAKIILEHANQLTERGHEVFIVCRDPRPTWMEVRSNYIQANQQFNLVHCIPEVDVIVCTVIDQLPECYLLGKAPVVLFEQGDVYIYEFETLSDELKEYYKKTWSIPVPLFCVSKILSDTIYKNFGRKGNILHNALNENVFFKREKSLIVTDKFKIMFVGQEDNAFKGIPMIREALRIVEDSGYDFDEYWITQTPPQTKYDGNLLISPSQEELGNAYRTCDIFISGSYYESFPLPPLEAMACGCAVVSTDNKGVMEYAVNNENCLLGKVGDSLSLASCIIELIENEEKRFKLVKNGYHTAEKFKWQTIMSEWEEFLNDIIEGSKIRQKTLVLPFIRVEIIPNNLNYAQAHHYIEKVLLNMNEDWCLFLIEGETLEEGALHYIKKIIAKGELDNYFIPIKYENDVPEHPISRLEKRLLKKGQTQTDELMNPIIIPITIGNGHRMYFLPKWMEEIRDYYINREYQRIVNFTKSNFSTFSIPEKLVASKWLVLALLEQDQYHDAFNILNSAMELDITYSDLLYLCARLLLMMGNKSDGKRFFELARFCGTSFFSRETFLNMEEICDSYLEML